MKEMDSGAEDEEYVSSRGNTPEISEIKAATTATATVADNKDGDDAQLTDENFEFKAAAAATELGHEHDSDNNNHHNNADEIKKEEPPDWVSEFESVLHDVQIAAQNNNNNNNAEAAQSVVYIFNCTRDKICSQIMLEKPTNDVLLEIFCSAPLCTPGGSSYSRSNEASTPTANPKSKPVKKKTIYKKKNQKWVGGGLLSLSSPLVVVLKIKWKN